MGVLFGNLVLVQLGLVLVGSGLTSVRKEASAFPGDWCSVVAFGRCTVIGSFAAFLCTSTLQFGVSRIANWHYISGDLIRSNAAQCWFSESASSACLAQFATRWL